MAATTIYTDGTITFTNGSSAIVGSGTAFTSLLVGDPVFGPDGKWYEIDTITDDTHATLDRVYGGTTAAASVGGSGWVIFKSAKARDSVRTATKQLTDVSGTYRQVINLTASDQTLRLSKATTADRAGQILQKNGVDMFQVGSFEDDDFSVRYLLAAAWTKALGIDATSGAVSVYSALMLKNFVTPAQITADTNDYNPPGLAQSSVLRLSTDQDRTVTGLAGGVEGLWRWIYNVGTKNLILGADNASSSAANRFSMTADLVLAPGAGVMLGYDGTSSRWRVMGGGGAAGGAGPLEWTFSTTTTDADPGAGNIRFDNATFGSITTIFIDTSSRFGVDLATLIDTWDDSSSTVKGVLTIADVQDGAKISVFNLTSITSATGYRKLVVTPVTGSIPLNARRVSVGFVANGAQGTPGTNGTNGTNGAAATIAVGTVTTGAAGSSAFVNNVGTSSAATFDFTIPRGDTGADGTPGAQGPSAGIRQAYSTITTDADPGAGTFRLNNATPASATAAYLDNVDAGGTTVSAIWDTYDDSTSTTRGYIRFEKSTDPTKWVQFRVTGSVVDGTGYRKLTLTGGVGSGAFTNGDTFTINFFRTGDSSAGDMLAANNLSDLADKTTALKNLGAKFGQCRLIKSGSNIVLMPFDGNLLTINGRACTIPAAGVSLAPTGLTVASNYYIYAVETSGVVTSIEASATGHSTSSTAGNVGVEIKTGDDTRTLVGLVRPITGPAFADSFTQRLVISWFNQRELPLRNQLTANRTTTNTSSWDELHTEIRCEFLVLKNPTTDFQLVSYSFNSGSNYTSGAIGFNGTTISASGLWSSSFGTNGSAIATRSIDTLLEGFNFATALGGVSAGTGTFGGGGSGRTWLVGKVWG